MGMFTQIKITHGNINNVVGFCEEGQYSEAAKTLSMTSVQWRKTYPINSRLTISAKNSNGGPFLNDMVLRVSENGGTVCTFVP
ncbi:hypothetical protein [Glaciecola sp. SC05]|uniref:hypothetical protein n=1 Tax=Glaciecola sp. SC05 TaxID=1987355 RepID=UPI0035278B26